MKRAFHVLVVLSMLAALIAVAGCSSSSSGPAAGQNSVVVAKATLPVGDSNCPTGGISVESGIDTNSNGVLDPSEVTNTQYVCNGADGTAGTAGADGANGTNGSSVAVTTTAITNGSQICVSQDTNGNGVADSSEPQYSCITVYVTGTVAGTVKTATGLVSLASVTVTATPSGTTAVTAADGSYSLTLPAGTYSLAFTKTNFTATSVSVNAANNLNTTANVTMAEAASGAPSVSLVITGNVNDLGYGQTFTATANATSPVGATPSYSWTNATMSSGNTATYTSQSFNSAIAGIPAPSNDPGGYVSPYVLNNRFEVFPVNADTRGAVSVSVKVTDGQGGSTTSSATVNSAAPQPGVRQLTLNVPAYINSGTSSPTQTWGISVPGGSTATISTALTGTARVASFTPDVEGAYTITSYQNPTKTMVVYAGAFQGAISGGGYTSKTFSSTDDKAGMWFDPADAGHFGYFNSGTASSWTYTNWPTVTKKSGCNLCHNGATAVDMWASWSQTAHATFFSRGLEGITGNSNSCVACHTVGSDGVNVGNGGYDDMVASTGFVYTKGIGAWSRMTASYPTVATMANIQCENCHGANSSSEGDATTGHGTAGTGGTSYTSYETSTAAARVSFSAEVCGTCHSSGTGHHNFSEWEHLNPDNGMGHGKKAQNQPVGHGGANCACHSAQAFALKLTQFQSGNPYYALDPGLVTWASLSVVSANTVSLSDFPSSAVTLTYPTADSNKSEPQTCTVCHDPHDATNPNQLRVYNSYNTANWGGFTVDGLGKGAICTVCHNSRATTKCGGTSYTSNSISSAVTVTGLCTSPHSMVAGGSYLHEDMDPFNNGAMDTYTVGHDAAQGEVLMGRSAYFMGNSLPMLSKHANVEDSCVGCHMTLNPQTHLSHNAPATSTHVWYITDADASKVCANCHSSNVNGEGLMANVDDLYASIPAAMANNFQTQVNTSSLTSGGTLTLYNVSSWSNPTGTYVQTIVISTATTTYASTGGTSIKMASISINSVPTVTATSFNFANLCTDPSPAVCTPFITTSNILVKAAWNYHLLGTDDSHGVHNPSFVMGVLTKTLAAMNENTANP